jgi:hypothetical protein
MIVSHVALILLIMLRIRMYVYISVTCDKTKQCKMQGPNEAVQQPMYVLLHPTSYIIAIALVYLSFVDRYSMVQVVMHSKPKIIILD